MSGAASAAAWGRCAAHGGLPDHYEAHDGRERPVPEAAVRRALRAMGVMPERPPEPASLPSCVVLREGQVLHLRWQETDATPAHWELQALDPISASPLADGVVAHEAGWASVTHALALPLGYYRIRVRTGVRQQGCLLAVAPRRCWVPAQPPAGQRWWGYCVQLHALRSRRNAGIGDFGDLRRLIDMAAAQGAAFIGLNPLHALFADRPEQASPYSASSRLALNTLYLDLEAVVASSEWQEARAAWADPQYQQRLHRLRDAHLVDYAGVAACKEELLSLAWHAFEAQELKRRTRRGLRFRAYLVERYATLGMHAVFEALQAHLARADPAVRSWQDWPAALRDPHGTGVQAFCQQHASAVRYRLWLQWLAEQQLAEAQAHALRCGMRIGLYRDLAVGVDPGGSETWSPPDLYATDMHIGRPPAPPQRQGQDWGRAAPTPWAPGAAAYQPFIDTLRANLRSAGALRLDHVMALMRPFWTGPEGGTDVRYPIDDLMGLLALESHRHQCLVVGEDLGTVPQPMREAMQQACVLSYRPLVFAHDPATGFPPPQDFPALAFAAFGTPDLPTLAAFWQGLDLELQHALTPARFDLQMALQRRRQVCDALLHALQHAGAMAPQDAQQCRTAATATPALVAAVHAYLGRTPCWLVGVQLEDATRQRLQVTPPGTRRDQHPNWRRKLGSTLDELGTDEGLAAVVQALRSARGPQVRQLPPDD